MIFFWLGCVVFARANGEFSGNVIINEFLASNNNTNGLRDEDGELQDWIEIYNRGDAAVNLSGWSLTDNAVQPDQWIFPEAALGARQYLIVFASGKDRRPTTGANLHSNFKLSASGEYLGLFTADSPRQMATQFQPAFPAQRPDLSYGLFGVSFGYSTNPTPATVNSGAASFNGIAADPAASIKSGFFNSSFSVALSTVTPNAFIRYTLNGSVPTLVNGILYTGPITISGSSSQGVINLRAVAFRNDMLESKPMTCSYIFPESVLAQSLAPAGFPATWVTTTNGGSTATTVTADYEMDPQIITNTAYTSLARQALTNLPTLCIVMETDDLFSQGRGIYANPNPPVVQRDDWERPASAELILPDGSAGFKMDAGLSVHGCTSRDPNRTKKHSFHLHFNSSYSGHLNYPMFKDSPAQSFDSLILDATSNLSWANANDSMAYRAQYVRDQFCNDLQQVMAHPSPHGRYVNLYLNGLYWGVIDVRERPDADFAAAYFGGAAAQYDSIRNTCAGLEVLNGDDGAWSTMMSLVNSSLSDNSQYEQLQQYLDVPSFIDYMIVNIYAGNTDWAMHNWYASRKRVAGAGFQFESWDAEYSLYDVNGNVSGYNQPGSPTAIHSFLRNNAEYRLLFADHVQKFFFNGGCLYVDPNNPAVDPANPQRNRPGALYTRRIAEIDSSMVLESARWGDSIPSRENTPFTRNVEWLNELNWLKNSYFPQRSSTVLNQFKSQLLYPGDYGVQPPVFSQHGGNVAAGFSLTLSASAGTIYYTTNGSDPRVYGTAALSPDAIAYTGTPVVISSTKVIKARVKNGESWSPLDEATFFVAQLTTPLRLTELMYKPIGGDAYEFIELQNVGATPLDLSGYSFDGITYAFPAGTLLGPNAVTVLAPALNPLLWATRYPGVLPSGYYTDKLSNNGERIGIKDVTGRTITSVTYNPTNGWPHVSNGSSIEVIDPLGDPNAPSNWRASVTTLGTPGVITAPPAVGPVLINELMARNSGSLINNGITPDWIELFNSSASAVALSGWSMTDDDNARKFVFPPGAVIAAGGYLVVYCDSQTNAPGWHTGFALNDNGESIFLFNTQTSRVDAITYGAQIADLSIGRVGGVWQLNAPTPNSSNQSAPTGPVTPLVINEWMANSPVGQSDWFELYNPSSQPIALRSVGVGASNALFQITSLSFIAPRSYLPMIADEMPGANHVDFKLPSTGSAIILYDLTGQEINHINYGAQLNGVSQGRLPDGEVNFVSFPNTSSPGTANYLVPIPPTIIEQPQSTNVSVGANVKFAASATGSGSLRCQWYLRGQPIGGETNLDLILANIGTPNAGDYQLAVANLAGSAVSDTALLTIQSLDSDGDGIPDAWEMAHGLDPNASNALADSDHDGMTDYQEYLAGTEPLDATSSLKLTTIPSVNGNITLNFVALPGKSYAVDARDSLTAAWSRLIDYPAQTATYNAGLVDHPANGIRFYRLVLISP